MPPPDVEIHRLSVDDVRRMVETGVLREEDRVELLDGVLVDVTPPSADHSAAVAWLTRLFVRGVEDAEVRVQDLLLVEGGFVMPDLMVVDPLPRDRQPSMARLVVEVSVTTQAHDAAKARRYARAGVTEYWMVDAPARVVHAHRRPSAAGYADVTPYRDGSQIETDLLPEPVAVSELLG
jgi:Uma2 family endonuclease